MDIGRNHKLPFRPDLYARGSSRSSVLSHVFAGKWSVQQIRWRASLRVRGPPPLYARPLNQAV